MKNQKEEIKVKNFHKIKKEIFPVAQPSGIAIGSQIKKIMKDD